MLSNVVQTYYFAKFPFLFTGNQVHFKHSVIKINALQLAVRCVQNLSSGYNVNTLIIFDTQGNIPPFCKVQCSK